MRKLVYVLPAVLISACSVIDQPYLPSDAGYSGGTQYAQGQYGGCASGACASGQGYSVAAQGSGQQGAYQNRSAHGAPVHVNPTGYGQGYQGAGYQGAGYGAGPRAGYGVPALRGTRGRRGNAGGFYGTLGGVLYDTDIDSFGLEGRIGYDSGRIFGAEVEGSIGIIDEDDTVSSANGPVELESGFDYNVAAFAVARWPLTQRLSLHTRAGYDFREITVEGEDSQGNTAEASADLDGFAFGVGAQYLFSPRSGLRIDYTSYDNDIGEAESLSASYVRKF